MSTSRPKKAAAKNRRTRLIWLLGTVSAIAVLLVVVALLHKPGSVKGSPFGPQAGSSSTPATQPAPSATSPNANSNPGNGSIDGESTLPDATTRQIKQVVTGFVDAYYTDPPNANYERVQPYLAPGYVGPLPGVLARSSNAGQSFYADRTVSIAALGGIDYDLAAPSRVILTVTITQTTSYEGGSGTNWYTFTRTITLTKAGSNWLVAGLAEGVYGT